MTVRSGLRRRRQQLRLGAAQRYRIAVARRSRELPVFLALAAGYDLASRTAGAVRRVGSRRRPVRSSPVASAVDDDGVEVPHRVQVGVARVVLRWQAPGTSTLRLTGTSSRSVEGEPDVDGGYRATLSVDDLDAGADGATWLVAVAGAEGAEHPLRRSPARYPALDAAPEHGTLHAVRADGGIVRVRVGYRDGNRLTLRVSTAAVRA